MATVSITAAKGMANGAVTAGTTDTVTCSDFVPSDRFTVGVFDGEAASVVVGLHAGFNATPGHADGGEPAYLGRDVVVTAEQLRRSGGSGNKTIYVASPTGTVEYWVKAT